MIERISSFLKWHYCILGCSVAFTIISSVISLLFRKTFVFCAWFGRGTSDLLRRHSNLRPFFFCTCVRFPKVHLIKPADKRSKPGPYVFCMCERTSAKCSTTLASDRNFCEPQTRDLKDIPARIFGAPRFPIYETTIVSPATPTKNLQILPSPFICASFSSSFIHSSSAPLPPPLLSMYLP